MWSRREMLLTLAAATLSPGSPAQEADAKDTPLSHATLIVKGPKDDAQLEQVLREFCAAEHLELARKSRSVGGRQILDFSTTAVEKTYFSATNEPAPGSFDIYVFSRAPREVWQPLWNRLIQRIRQQVGPNRVFVSHW